MESIPVVRFTPTFTLRMVFVCAFMMMGQIAYAQNESPALSPSSTQLAPAVLDLWNDPSFQKRFAESYIAETEIEPTVTLPEREQMQEVLELISSDQLDQAAVMLQEIQSPDTSAVIDFTLANIYFQQDNLEGAAVAYEAAVEKFPKFLRAWKNLGLIHVRNNDFPKAIPALTRVLELGGGDSVTFGLLGFAYSSAENHLAAESAYRMAILMDGETLDWKMGLARSFFKQERYPEAVALCNQLLQTQPERADLWLLQANGYIGLQQPMKAAENYEIVESLGKSTPESLNMLGDIYINEELYGLAVQNYIRAMELQPEGSAERVVRSARILVARGALDETGALVAAIESTIGDTMNTEDRKNMLKIKARLAVATGAGDEEVQVLKEIVQLDPLDGEALILLGQHSARTGDIEQAIFYYERAAGIEEHEADANIRHAQLLVGEGRYAEALPLLRRAQMINPRDNVQQFLEQVERIAKSG